MGRGRFDRRVLRAAGVGLALVAVLWLVLPRGVSRAGAARTPAHRALVTTGAVEDVFLLSGEIRAVHFHEIGVPAANRPVAIQWLAQDGAEVQEGDPVIAFDSGELLRELEERRLRSAQAAIALENKQHLAATEVENKHLALERAEIEREKKRIEAAVPPEVQARREWQDRQSALRRAEGAVQKARLELAARQVASRSDVETARIDDEKARRELDMTLAQLHAFQVKAPRAGFFFVQDYWRSRENRKFQPGDQVFSGMSVGRVSELADVEVVARLSEVDLGRVSPGQPVRCVLDAFPEQTYPGRITDVGTVAEPDRGFVVRAALDSNDRERMRPGMSVRLEVVRATWPAALRVPRQAVTRDGAQTHVRIAGQSVSIRLATCTATACVVEAGLEAGQYVELP